MLENILGIMVIFVILMIAVLSFYALWLVFIEADKPGWAVFIPGYGQYIMAKIARKSSLIAWLFTTLALVNTFLYALSYNSFEKPIETISNVVGVILFISMIYIVIGMARQFSGVSKAFWIAYLLLPALCLFELRKLEYKK